MTMEISDFFFSFCENILELTQIVPGSIINCMKITHLLYTYYNFLPLSNMGIKRKFLES